MVMRIGEGDGESSDGTPDSRFFEGLIIEFSFTFIPLLHMKIFFHQEKCRFRILRKNSRFWNHRKSSPFRNSRKSSRFRNCRKSVASTPNYKRTMRTLPIPSQTGRISGEKRRRAKYNLTINFTSPSNGKVAVC